MTLRVGWFSTGRGEGSRRLLTAAVDAIRGRHLDAEIAFVFCNRERGEHEATDGFLDLVQSFGFPALTLSSRRFRKERGGALSQRDQPLPPWREEYDRAVLDLVSQHEFDVGVLAGYMLIFTGEAASRYPFLNLHPAEPGGPTGTWQQVIWQLIDTNAAQSGVMIHLATEELDSGPPVACATFSIRGPGFDALWAANEGRSAADIESSDGDANELFRAIRRHGAARELPLVVETLRAVADRRVRIEGRRVVDGQGRALPHGLDLSAEIDASVAAQLAKSN